MRQSIMKRFWKSAEKFPAEFKALLREVVALIAADVAKE